MASSRRSSNGRSPLVNQQRQITSFFTKSASPTPSPSPSSVPSKQKPNPNLSPSPSPTTPSPLIPKRKKPLLVIGGGAASSLLPSTKADWQSYGEEVIGKKIKVYWPLEKSWYEGCVKSFDKKGGKHIVEYDDGDEESLDLRSEKIEWIQDTMRKLKRLRRLSSDFKRTMIEEDEESGNIDVEEGNEEAGDGDDSSDEDWGKNEMVENEDEDTDMELINDKEDVENETEKLKGKRGSKVATKKRKVSELEKSVSPKKSKTNMDASNGVFKVSGKEPSSNSDGEC